MLYERGYCQKAAGRTLEEISPDKKAGDFSFQNPPIVQRAVVARFSLVHIFSTGEAGLASVAGGCTTLEAGRRQGMYADRKEAAQRLIGELEEFRGADDVLILAIPRGGVPIAYEVSQELGIPFDVVVIKKIGAPGHEELAAGAASADSYIVNEDVVRSMGLSREYMEERARAKQAEVRERLKELRGSGEERYPIEGKRVIIMDDGIATGSTMEMAVKIIRKRSPKEVVIAVPVAPPETVKRLSGVADRVICPEQPHRFMAIGQFYRDFRQVPTEEARSMLQKAVP